ncbi:hypothetical protein F5148DRAFT_87006 [Russula earlei]|uniref:Uncharacterized protein n=1 Tax=Russula earlei TaxID=71964 RepID=A0ACC0U7I8_9AGAM|nr:hypothetical protein F5148DRAFT_87006 [Russula earlei]
MRTPKSQQRTGSWWPPSTGGTQTLSLARDGGSTISTRMYRCRAHRGLYSFRSNPNHCLLTFQFQLFFLLPLHTPWARRVADAGVCAFSWRDSTTFHFRITSEGPRSYRPSLLPPFFFFCLLLPRPSSAPRCSTSASFCRTPLENGLCLCFAQIGAGRWTSLDALLKPRSSLERRLSQTGCPSVDGCGGGRDRRWSGRCGILPISPLPPSITSRPNRTGLRTGHGVRLLLASYTVTDVCSLPPPPVRVLPLRSNKCVRISRSHDASRGSIILD